MGYGAVDPASFVHLHAHSAYSFLDGASLPSDLVARAVTLGQGELALTDWCGVYGAPEFAAACAEHGVRPLFGAEIDVPEFGHLTLLIKDRAGWRSLCHLITAARHTGRKKRAPVAWESLARHAEGLICLSGCRHGALAAPLLRGDEAAAWAVARRLRELFRGDLWIEIARNRVAGEGPLGRSLARLAARLGVGAVATANVHYADPGDGSTADLLACVREGTTLAAARHLRSNHCYFLSSAAEMTGRFRDLPEAVANTREVAACCTFELRFGRHQFPAVPIPAGRTPGEELRARCRGGLTERYAGAGAARWREARDRLDDELGVIERLGLAGYFLVVHDLVRFAAARGIAHQGRGSSAGSITAYSLRISRVEPIGQGLLFARFLNEARADALPDVDIDFGSDRREEIIQHLFATYGRAATAMTITYQQYHRQGAVADAGKALGLPRPALGALTTRLRRGLDPDLPAAIDAVAGPGASADRPWSTLIALVPRLIGLPRHTSIHNGGVVLVSGELADICPIEPATMADRQVVQWDKEGLEAVGLVKLDVLGLRALDLVDVAARLVGDGRGGPFPLDDIPPDDPAVYGMLTRAETLGVFQLESPAQMALLPRLRPRCLDDLTAATALIRPGPVQGGMVPAFLARRSGEEAVRYAHPLLEPVLRETHGVLLYQESVLTAAIALAGFAAEEADELRRAMGSKRSAAKMAALERRFLAGAAAQGVLEAVARDVFAQIRAFSGYGFVKAHAASFALIAYETAWLKRHYPLEFWTARLIALPGGGWPFDAYVQEARRLGVWVLGPDLNRSAWRPTIEADERGRALRLGLWFVRGLQGDEVGPRLVAERERHGPYRDLADLCRRTRDFLTPTTVEALILAGACDGWKETRRRLSWRLPTTWHTATGLDLPVEPPTLPSASGGEVLSGEAWATGMPLSMHPAALVRPALDAAGVLPLRELAEVPAGATILVAGRPLLIRRPPTGKGTCFVSIDDESAIAQMVLDEATDRRYRANLHAPVVVAEGVVQRRHNVVSLRVTALRPWSSSLRARTP